MELSAEPTPAPPTPTPPSPAPPTAEELLEDAPLLAVAAQRMALDTRRQLHLALSAHGRGLRDRLEERLWRGTSMAELEGVLRRALVDAPTPTPPTSAPPTPAWPTPAPSAPRSTPPVAPRRMAPQALHPRRRCATISVEEALALEAPRRRPAGPSPSGPPPPRRHRIDLDGDSEEET